MYEIEQWVHVLAWQRNQCGKQNNITGGDQKVKKLVENMVELYFCVFLATD